MEKGQPGMKLDREVFVWGSEIAAMTDSEELCEKATLVITSPDVFDDGIRIGDIKGTVCKGKRAAVAWDSCDSWIALSKICEVTLSERGDARRVRVEFFQIVVCI